MQRRDFIRGTAAAGVAGMNMPGVFAQGADPFPSKPIKIMVGFAAGGVTDLVVRAIAQAAADTLRQRVVVENRPGAGGVMPAQLLQSAPSDGYTLGLIVQSVFRLPYTMNAKWDPAKDLDYIIRLTGFTWGIVVPAKSPIKTFEDYIAFAKANPGQLTYATSGALTTQHLTMEQIAKKVGITLNHVPFKGTAEAIPALLGGHVMSMADASTWSPYVESGEMRLLVVWTDKRVARYPKVPTLKEVGIDLIQTSPWGLAAPNGTPPHVIQVLHDGFKAAMDAKVFKDILNKFDMEPQYMNGQAYQKFAEEQVHRETEALKSLGVQRNIS